MFLSLLTSLIVQLIACLSAQTGPTLLCLAMCVYSIFERIVQLDSDSWRNLGHNNFTESLVVCSVTPDPRTYIIESYDLG